MCKAFTKKYRNYEWLNVTPPAALDYYETFEQAKAAFSSAVQQGNVIRMQKIVTREALSRGDRYFGQTTDRECAIFAFVSPHVC